MSTANQPAKKGAAEKPEGETLPATTDRGSGPEAPGNVDKIRDILFGSQMRDYEKKFTRVEERLGRETADLREDIKRRFAALENFVKNEVTALTDQIKAEKSERADADKEGARELKEAIKAWEKKAVSGRGQGETCNGNETATSRRSRILQFGYVRVWLSDRNCAASSQWLARFG